MAGHMSSSLRCALFALVAFGIALGAVDAEDGASVGIRIRSSANGRLDLELPEELPVGTVVVDNVLRVSGLAASSSSSDGMQLDVVSGSYRDYFRVEASTGSLMTTRVIDRDEICHRRSVSYWRLLFLGTIVNFYVCAVPRDLRSPRVLQRDASSDNYTQLYI